ncbi:TonB-dependent receptor [Phenylobacterium sp. LjRoot219]|uniref:TonB-dependent receptor n=1 Tax=Phenylobacterium sp. LjRoot219 TaxID=3342283 RepID=UPI003ECE1D31
MKTRLLKRALCLTTALSAIAAPAFAQQTEATMDTVVVTARRMDERLQDVPISITVFNQQQLSNRNVVSGADLATYTPSLTANSRFGTNNTTFAIRGFTQELRTTSSVAIYFADVVAPRGGNGGQPAGDGAVPGSFFDLQNVQVLKGPQGTLFGRNTTGGAVLLVPQKPTREFEGYAEASLGNYNMARLQGVVNMPLAENARARVGFDTQSRDGYAKNISGIGPRRFGDLNYTSFRASLVADLTEDLENYSIFSYNRSHDNGPLAKLTSCVTSPTEPNGTFPFGLLSCQQMARQANNGFFTVQNLLPDAESKAKQWQLINTTTWRASDALTIKNIISYSRLTSLIKAESFGTQFIIPTQFGPIPNTGALAGTQFGFARSYPAKGLNTADQDNFTEELQFQGRTEGDKLIWQAGAYYEESNPVGYSGAQSPVLLSCTDSTNLRCTDVMAALLRRPAVGSLNYAIGQVAFQNKALYAQGTYALLDNLKLTGGIRYTWDRTTATAQSITYRFFQPNVPTPNCTLLGPTPITDPNICIGTNKQKSDKPTWVVGLDFNPVDDVLLYGKYSRGYRQGAVNYSAPSEFQTFGPEKVDTYEVGAKTSWSGSVPGSFNIAAFYNDFTNQQLAVGLISSTSAAAPTQAIINGGKSRIYGVEIDASVRPFEGFTLEGSYAYLNTKLKTLTTVTAAPGGPYDIFQFAALAGSRLPFTPENKATVTATYHLPLNADIGDVALAATWAYSGDYLVTQGPFGTLPSVNLLNLNANWDSISGKPVDLQFFVTNVTNEKYYTGVNDQRTSAGFVSQQMAQPRMYGVRLRARFGG